MSTETAIASVETTDGPDIKFLQYWWKIVCGEDSKNYTFVDASTEHFEGGKCRITYKLVNKETGEEKLQYVTIKESGFVSLGSLKENEEGGLEEEKGASFKNLVGSLMYNFLFFVDKIRGKV